MAVAHPPKQGPAWQPTAGATWLPLLLPLRLACRLSRPLNALLASGRPLPCCWLRALLAGKERSGERGIRPATPELHPSQIKHPHLHCHPSTAAARLKG